MSQLHPPGPGTTRDEVSIGRVPVPRDPNGRRFRPDIEGLRAVAVLLVVLYHAGVPGLTGGYVGVDVFFVISGFLITSHLVKELDAGRLSLAAFYARRARRLLPLSCLVLLTTVTVSWLFLPPLETRATFHDALWTALFSMNLLLARQGVDYQTNSEPSPLQHYWSLGVEEQFYLGWPLLLLAISAVWALVARHRAARGGRPASRRRWIAVVVAVLAVVSFLGSMALLRMAQPYAYFLSPARAWELAVGGLVALAAPFLVRRTRGRLASVLAVLGLVAVVAAGFVYSDATPFPGPTALLPVLGTALVIAAGLGGPTLAERAVLGRRPAQFVGRLSYGWYLWHWPALLLVPALLDTDLTLPLGLSIAAATVLLSLLSFHVLEDPVRRAVVLRPRYRALGLGAVLTAFALVVPAAAGATAPSTTGSGAPAAAPDLSPAALTATLRDGLADRPVPVNLTPTLDTAADDRPGASPVDGISCHVDLPSTDLAQGPGGSCVYGDPEGATTLVLTGDSHAQQWLPAFDLLGREQGVRIVALTKSSCPVYDLPIFQTALGRDYTECYSWRQAVLERIRTESPDVVVTSATSTSSGAADDLARSARRWTEGVSSSLPELGALAGRVVVLADTPYPGGDVPRCVSRHLDDASYCALDAVEAQNYPERRAALIAAAEASRVEVIDPVPWLCTEGRCPVVLGDTLVYRDQSHLSATMAARLVPELTAALA